VVAPGFTSFVAWRYLMARPRRWPRPVISLIGMCLVTSAVALAVGFGLEWWWKHHEKGAPYNPLVLAMSHIHQYDERGVWLLRGIGAALALIGLILARWLRTGNNELLPLPRHLGGHMRVPMGPMGAAVGVASVALTAADLRTWRSVIGWTLLLGGGVVTVLGIGGQFMVGESPLTLLLTHQVWWIALAPIALLLPLLFFRYLFTFFTTVSVAGVFVGSMALVVVLSVMSGFENDLREKILGSNAHIRVTREEGTIADWRPVMERLRGVPGVVAVTPYATTEVVLSANSNYSTVIIKGIDPTTIGDVTDLVADIEGTPAEDTEAMKRLYPLRPDDTGEPEPAEPTTPPRGTGTVTDPAPDDMTDGAASADYSDGADSDPDHGDDDEPAAAPEADAGVDRAPDDFAGGAEDGEEPEDYGTPRDDEPISLQDRLAQAEKEPLLLDAPSDDRRLQLLDGVLVGKELSKQLHLYIGQEVRLVSPLADPANPDATGTPIPFHRDYRVAGIFYTGMYEYDLKFVYVPLESLEEFLQLGDEIDGIEVRIHDPDATGTVSARIRHALGSGYVVQDWKELNRNLFSALKLEKIAMFLVLAIIILVASFSIVGNLIMVVVEKQKEIALVKTLGAGDVGVMLVFVMQGFFIGAVGTLIGVLEGLLICLVCQELGFPINENVYYISTLPIHIEPLSIAAVAFAGLVISAIATVYPAVLAARLRPAIGLRHD